MFRLGVEQLAQPIRQRAHNGDLDG